jgi:outer membrane murein-binding lipoprotein Lpp
VLWVPVAAWGAAVVVAAVVLGFCAYEIRWKADRLRADMRKLQATADELTALRGELAAVQERVAATGLR